MESELGKLLKEVLERITPSKQEKKIDKEIADKIFLSEKTVKHYMTNILHKLQVRNRVEAALLVQKSKLNS